MKQLRNFVCESILDNDEKLNDKTFHLANVEFADDFNVFSKSDCVEFVDFIVSRLRKKVVQDDLDNTVWEFCNGKNTKYAGKWKCAIKLKDDGRSCIDILYSPFMREFKIFVQIPKYQPIGHKLSNELFLKIRKIQLDITNDKKFSKFCC